MATNDNDDNDNNDRNNNSGELLDLGPEDAALIVRGDGKLEIVCACQDGDESETLPANLCVVALMAALENEDLRDRIYAALDTALDSMEDEDTDTAPADAIIN